MKEYVEIVWLKIVFLLVMKILVLVKVCAAKGLFSAEEHDQDDDEAEDHVGVWGSHELSRKQLR